MRGEENISSELQKLKGRHGTGGGKRGNVKPNFPVKTWTEKYVHSHCSCQAYERKEGRAKRKLKPNIML